jgi:hypothetical protein
MKKEPETDLGEIEDLDDGEGSEDIEPDADDELEVVEDKEKL